MTVVSFSRAVLPEIVYYVHGQAMTRSDMVARFFGRPHQQVMLHIDALKPDLPLRWCEHNFLQLRVSSHPADACSGKPQAYQMTRDGFILLAMSFSGKKSASAETGVSRSVQQGTKRVVGRHQRTRSAPCIANL